LDMKDPNQAVEALKGYTSQNAVSFAILEGFPNSADSLEAFLKAFGEPRVLMDLKVGPESMQQRAERIQGADYNEEAFQAEVDAAKPGYDAMMELATNEKKPLKSYCAIPGEGAVVAVTADMRRRVLPKVYVLLAPQGRQFAKNVASAMCRGPKQRGSGRTPAKYTLIDAEALVKRGGHSAEIEEELAKLALLPPEASGRPTPVSPSLWTKLFEEFFAKSADPLGNFVVVNYPSITYAATGYPTPRDLFDVLESVASLEGFVSTAFASESSLAQLSLADTAATEYKNFAAKVLEFVILQYDADGKVAQLELDEEDTSVGAVSERVVSEFFKHYAEAA